MIFFTENPIVFDAGEFYAIQTMAGLPFLPPGRTLIGQGYNLVASSNLTREITGSISIQYLGNDVLAAGADEEDLSLYYWDGDEWTALDTILDTYFNMASAPSQGTGVYALMASVKIPLYGPGWNLFSYHARETQPVTQALLSISGYYTTVYGYEPDGPVTDTWKVYDVTAPDWVNDLEELKFGHGYWINVSQSITLHLNSGETRFLGKTWFLNTMPLPPATFYGTVLAGSGFTPAAGMKVSAWIDGDPSATDGNVRLRASLCGQARMMEIDGQVVYAIDVLAEDAGVAVGCGVPGKEVTFQVGLQAMATATVWDNKRLWELALRPGWRVYLPLVLKD